MIRVASFNVKNLNLGNDEESKQKRDLDKIATLIKEYDIVALQEVLTPLIIEGSRYYKKTLTSLLGSDWKGKWVDPKSSSKYYPYLGKDNRGEGYAFLWNTKNVDLLTDKNGGEIVPSRYSHYKAGENKLRLIRDPAYGRFKLKNRPVEIRVITTHIIFGKPKDENLRYEIDYGAVQMRRNEFNLLAGKIYKNINDNRKDEHINAVYTIIVGDYNLNLKGGEVSNATIPMVCCYDSYGNLCPDGDNKMMTVQQDLTTIKKDCSGYANNYDHCTYNIKIKDVIGECKRIAEVNENDSVEIIKQYFQKVSDHVPIMVELNC